MRRLQTQASALPHKPSRGFTLLELITVILILSILSATVAPRLIQNDSQERATAEQLRSNLRYAQRVAATRNRDVCVSSTPFTVTFRIASQAGIGMTCAANALTPFNDANGTLDIALTPGGTLRFTSSGNFRFTASGMLADNAGNPVGLSTLSLTNGSTVFATFNIQADNGYVFSSNF